MFKLRVQNIFCKSVSTRKNVLRPYSIVLIILLITIPLQLAYSVTTPLKPSSRSTVLPGIIEISGKASDDNGIAWVEVALDGGKFSRATPMNQNDWRIWRTTINTQESTTTDGAFHASEFHTIKVRAMDLDKNMGETSILFCVRTVGGICNPDVSRINPGQIAILPPQYRSQ